MNSTPSYPTQYESHPTLKNGVSVFLRPILPSDAPLILGLFEKLSEQARYLRFLRHMDALPQEMLYRFVHVDYASEFALAAVIEENGKEAIVAVARYACASPGEPADLALAVRDDWQNLGLGKLAMGKIIEIGKANGFNRFVSMMDSRNAAMKHILAGLGYQVSYSNSNGIYTVNIVA